MLEKICLIAGAFATGFIILAMIADSIAVKFGKPSIFFENKNGRTYSLIIKKNGQEVVVASGLTEEEVKSKCESLNALYDVKIVEEK